MNYSTISPFILELVTKTYFNMSVLNKVLLDINESRVPIERKKSYLAERIFSTIQSRKPDFRDYQPGELIELDRLWNGICLLYKIEYRPAVVWDIRWHHRYGKYFKEKVFSFLTALSCHPIGYRMPLEIRFQIIKFVSTGNDPTDPIVIVATDLNKFEEISDKYQQQGYERMI